MEEQSFKATEPAKDAEQPVSAPLADPVKEIVQRFGGLTPRVRVALFDQLEKAIHHDRDLLSAGREPGPELYDQMAEA